MGTGVGGETVLEMEELSFAFLQVPHMPTYPPKCKEAVCLTQVRLIKPLPRTHPAFVCQIIYGAYLSK